MIIPPEEAAQITVSFQEGETIASLSRRFERNRHTIRDVLVRSSVYKPRDRGEDRQKTITDVILSFEKTGNVASTSRQTGKSRTMIYRILKDAGMRIKPKKKPHYVRWITVGLTVEQYTEAIRLGKGKPTPGIRICLDNSYLQNISR